MKRTCSLLLIFLLVIWNASCFAESLQIPDISTVNIESPEEVITFLKLILAENTPKDTALQDITFNDLVLIIEVDISQMPHANESLTEMEYALEFCASCLTDPILQYTELDACWEFIIIDSGAGVNVIFTKEDIVDSEYGRFFEGGAWNTF